MPHYLTPLTAALIVGLCLPVLAQETTATGTETTASDQVQVDPAPNTDGDLSLGEDVSATPQIGDQYTAEVVGAWDIRCLKTEDDTDPCQMYQLLDDGQGAAIAEFSMFRLPDGGQAKAGATVIVPLETALPQQLTISVDGATGRRYPYSFCNSVGCYARIGLTEDDVNAFKRGQEATLTIVPALAPDQRVVVTLSLTGFTASYDKVSVVNP
jgi:invasion protein IalB